MTKRTCLGTREIRLAIDHKVDSVKENGTLMLFLTKNSRTTPIDEDVNECASIENQRGRSVEDGNTALDVMVTNGSITFRGYIDFNKVKITGPRDKKSRSIDKISSQEEKIKQVSSFILQQNSDVTVSYELVTHNDNSKVTTCARPEFGVQDVNEDISFVKMTIKQSLGSIVRIVWSGRLFMRTSKNKGEQQRNENDRKDYVKNNNAMEFIQAIRSELLQSDGVIKQLRQNESKLRSQMLSWKDTAEKMGDTWQEEKDGLLSKFLVLLNRVKGELRTAHKELKEERETNRLQAQQKCTPLIPHVSQKVDHLVDHEDEHDLECYDPEEVKRLAMGDTSQRSKRSVPNGNIQQVKKKQRQAVHKTESYESLTKQIIDRSMLVSQPEESLNVRCDHDPTFTNSQIMGQSQSSVRKNPYTGANEMWSAESIFSQDIHINAKSNNSNILNNKSEQVEYPVEDERNSTQNALILDRVTSESLKDPVEGKLPSNKGTLALNKTCISDDKIASKDTYDTDDDYNDDASDCSEALL